MTQRSVRPRVDHRGSEILARDPFARPAASGPVELGYRSVRVGATAKDGCGNDAPMEITERFPQPLGNLAQNARFPHSHSRLSYFHQKNQDTNPIHGPVPRSQGGARLSAGY